MMNYKQPNVGFGFLIHEWQLMRERNEGWFGALWMLIGEMQYNPNSGMPSLQCLSDDDSDRRKLSFPSTFCGAVYIIFFPLSDLQSIRHFQF